MTRKSKETSFVQDCPPKQHNRNEQAKKGNESMYCFDSKQGNSRSECHNGVPPC